MGIEDIYELAFLIAIELHLHIQVSLRNEKCPCDEFLY
jgi:hypothetical protein